MAHKSRERTNAITALSKALVWLSAAGLALAHDGALDQTKEADRLANDTGLLLKEVREHDKLA